MRRLFKSNPKPGSGEPLKDVGKQTATKLVISLVVEAVKRLFIDLGYPWF